MTLMVDPDDIRSLFDEAARIVDRDNGKLWGKALRVPLMVLYSESGAVVTDHRDRAGVLRNRDGLYFGRVPQALLAQTALEWGGVRWAVFHWPLPKNKLTRQILLIHEMWHAAMGRRGMSGHFFSAVHLDTLQGRIWIRLEWEALVRALEESGMSAPEPLRDALLFRRQRMSLFPGAEHAEADLDLTEGLAEFTGLHLAEGGFNRKLGYLRRRIEEAGTVPSLVRYFPYVTGPLYGFLFQHQKLTWTAEALKGLDLGKLAESVFDLQIGSHSQAELMERGIDYGIENLISEETDREQTRQERLVEFHKNWLQRERPALSLPIRNIRLGFDTSEVHVFDGNGVVLSHIRVWDDWGFLEADLAWIAGNRLILSPPVEDLKKSPLSGKGWTLNLKPGWEILPAERGPFPFLCARNRQP